MDMTFELRCRAKTVTFVVAYTPAETQKAGDKHAFSTALHSDVEEVYKHD